MNYAELKAFIEKYDTITLQTAAKIFRESNNFIPSFKDSLEVAQQIFNELGLE